jgi:hypothetical protein
VLSEGIEIHEHTTACEGVADLTLQNRSEITEFVEVHDGKRQERMHFFLRI